MQVWPRRRQSLVSHCFACGATPGPQANAEDTSLSHNLWAARRRLRQARTWCVAHPLVTSSGRRHRRPATSLADTQAMCLCPSERMPGRSPGKRARPTGGALAPQQWRPTPQAPSPAQIWRRACAHGDARGASGSTSCRTPPRAVVKAPTARALVSRLKASSDVHHSRCGTSTPTPCISALGVCSFGSDLSGVAFPFRCIPGPAAARCPIGRRPRRIVVEGLEPWPHATTNCP